jgi:uncharacterized damage-inducible protein DinB
VEEVVRLEAPQLKEECAMDNAFLVSLFRHKAWCNDELVAALRAAPREADRGQMAVALFTLDHTSIVDRIFKAHLSGTEHGITAVIARRLPDLDSLAGRLRETDAWYLDYAGHVTPDELHAMVEFTFVGDGDQGRMTRGEMLAHIITHGASHRGAIGKMLEGMNVPGAPDMVTTFEGRQRWARGRDSG